MTDEQTTATRSPITPAEPLYVLPDSNLFLQARALQELPWNELASNRDIVILVPRAVQKELSRLKSDGNSRRAKRARTTSTQLLQTATAPGHTITIRDYKPRVTLQLPTPTKPTAIPGDLDPTNPDDQIMAEVISFRARNPDKEAVLLTGDSDQIVSAVHHHLPYRTIPEHWLLSPEADERDKRITELERELRTLKKTEPNITITFHDGNDKATQEITIERDQYDPLPEIVIDELVMEVQARQPPEQGLHDLVGKQYPRDPLGSALLAVDPFQRYKAPTTEEVTSYYDRQYPSWIENLRETLRRLHTQLNAPSTYTTVTVILENQGTRPADGVILTIETHGRIQLTRKEPTTDPTLPQPPAPPKGTYVTFHRSIQDMLGGGMASFHNRFPNMPTPHPRDPNAFYREHGDGPTDEWRLNCDEFRHGDEKQLTLGIIVLENWQDTNTALTVTITARNLSTPATKTIVIRVDTTQRDTIAAARNLFDGQFKRKPIITIRQGDREGQT